MPKYRIDVTVQRTIRGVVRVEVHADNPELAEDYCAMEWDSPGRWPGGRSPTPDCWTTHEEEVWSAEHIKEDE